MNQAWQDLIAAACAARRHSYAPYSRFRVGAALLCADQQMITGVNVENASFGLSICAERSAISQAVTSGRRDFTAIAICADGSRPTPPCGACRQVLLEFAAPDLVVLLAGDGGTGGEVIETTLGALLPLAFTDFPGHHDLSDESESP